MDFMIGLLGAGGMAHEIFIWVNQSHYGVEYLYDSNVKKGLYLYNGNQYEVKNEIDNDCLHVIAVGYPKTKVEIVKDLKINLSNAIIHPSCVLGAGVCIGKGSVVSPLCTFTSNINIGKLVSINSNVTVGHDVKIGDMFHASPGVVVSGNCIIGDRVFLGSNSCIKEKVTICDDVIIGMGSVVLYDIKYPGVYAGNPARKIDG